MYKVVIEFHEETSADELERLAAMADKAFDNRAGKAQNKSDSPYCLSYEGGEADYGCLELGSLALEKQKDFVPYVKSWEWIDEDDPDEYCDILALAKKKVK